METKFYNDQDAFLAQIDEIATKTLPWEKHLTVELPIEGSTSGMIYHAADGSAYLFRDCALRSLRQRLHSEAELVTYVSNKALVEADASKKFEDYIAWALEVLRCQGCKEETKISVVDGKVNAFLSTEYCEVLDSKYVHDTAFEKIINFTGETNFNFRGWWDYAINVAEYTTSNKVEIDGKEYQKSIRVRTSDAGYSSIALGSDLRMGNKIIPMMSDIAIPHRASKKKDLTLCRKEFEENFDEALTQTEKVFTNSIAQANELVKIKLAHPQGAARKIAKTMGLPKQAALEAIEGFTGDTAWGLYLVLCDCIKNDDDTQKRIKTIGNVAKILGIKNWSKYDQEFEWK